MSKTKKTLFIVESPNKIKTLKKFLGSDFVVKASVGHVREIPRKGMNIKIKEGFEPIYKISSDKTQVVSEIKEEAKKASEIILATDNDMEGEAISWHLYDLLRKEDQKKCKRITFNSITQKDVLKALENKKDIDMDKVHAQKARQVLDRLIGYKISPLLWKAVASKTSAGRVQSIALKILSEREIEIKNFKPEDFWYIDALLKGKKGQFWARVQTKNKENRYVDEKLSKEDEQKLKQSDFSLTNVEKKEKKSKPYPPFDTSSLQTTCSSLWGWGAKKTASHAQKLYEAGLCFTPDTYIRDSNGIIERIGDLNGIKELNDINRSNYHSCKAIGKKTDFHYEGEIINIDLGGNTLRVTPDHLFPIYDRVSGKITDKKASEICPHTDFLLRKKHDIKNDDSKLTLSQVLSYSTDVEKKKIRFVFKKDFVKQIPKIKDYLFNEKAESTVYKLIRNDILPFNIIEKLLNDKVLVEEQLGNKYSHLTYQYGTAKPLYMPYELPENLLYLAGLVASDGCFYKDKIDLSALLLKNPLKVDVEKYCDIKKEVESLFRGWGVQNSSKNGLCFKSRLLNEIIFDLGIPYSPKSEIIDVPKLIHNKSSYFKSYLAGLWDGDGYFAINKIRGNDCSIQGGYTSKSKKIISQLQILLYDINIHSVIHKDSRSNTETLKISIYDIPLFYSLIKERSVLKSKVYESLEKDIGSNLRKEKPRSKTNLPLNKNLFDAIESSKLNKNIVSKSTKYDVWNYSRKSNNGLYKNKIPKAFLDLFVEIVQREEIESLLGFVYEEVISVNKIPYSGDVCCFQTDSGYFQVANGIWTHNCTYIRTDSFNISEEALESVREFINEKYESAYSTKKAIKYSKGGKSSAQEAHECIRPTNILDEGNLIGNSDEHKLYQLIRKRFIACQMSNCVMNTVTYEVDSTSKHKLIAKGQSIKFDGWRKVYDYSKTKEEILPDMTKGESLVLKDVDRSKHSTQPPPRYNEGSLIKKMEKEGVGRPSTYPSIMESIQKRLYVKKVKGKKGQLEVTDLGLEVEKFLNDNFDKDFFMDIKFTSELEDDLDLIANGENTFIETVQKTYQSMMAKVKEITGQEGFGSVSTDEPCQKCKDGTIVERNGKFGKFFSCDRYPKCKTIYVFEGDKYKIKEKSINKTTGVQCPDCKNGKLVERKNRKDGTKFFGCNKFPKCKKTLSEKDYKELKNG